MNTQLIPSSLIDRLLLKRDEAIAEAHAAHARLQKCLAACQDVGIEGMESALSGGFFAMPILSADWPAQAVAAIDAGAWNRLMKESGLFSYLNASARAEWNGQILHLSAPPLTRENIQSTFASLFADREAMFEQGVLAVFQRLSSSPLTGLPILLGQRLNIKGVLDLWGKVDIGKADAIDDLLRAMHLLDGKPAPDPRRKLSVTLRDAHQRAEIKLDNDYWSLHMLTKAKAVQLTFKRPILVDQLNAILVHHHPDAVPAPN